MFPLDGVNGVRRNLLARTGCRWVPECLEDWIGEDNPVRVIDVFVDEPDLAELGFSGVDPEMTGRPSYHPSALLKLYIYGYLNRVQSSRRLERDAGRNVEVMWLTGRLVPDHKTIADFRKDNGRAIRKVCAGFVELCREIGLLTKASVPAGERSATSSITASARTDHMRAARGAANLYQRSPQGHQPVGIRAGRSCAL